MLDESIQNEQFLNSPKTIKDIGEDIFLKLPFYKRKNEVDVIYINPVIYERIFKKKYDYESAKKDIIEKFSVTLNRDLGNEKLGFGFVDKQGDPTDIALNGNKGSGRAFYLYKQCNIKGDKTPFATSPRNDYNNGKYSLDAAIQEALISNVLNHSHNFNNFETLAIIDLKEEYLFPHTKEKLPCGLIIRYYEDKELYRFSHRFVNKKSFSKKELFEIAFKIGKLEGNKFIKRFLHGAWSIGNLSIDCNMIDLDTSFFVVGRHPQWSFTDRFITNFFGFEQKGQIKVLETIINSDLNIDEVKVEDLARVIEKEKIKTIRKEFSGLIGYDEIQYKKYFKYFDELADEFYHLSQLIFDNYDNLNCVDDRCQNTFLFDFSNFFRYYEILKQKGDWSIQKGLNLLINKDAYFVEYVFDDEEDHKKILGFFESIIIDTKEKYLDSISRAIKFIEKFDILNSLIDKNESVDKNNKLIKAYIENEDKTYLIARKWIRLELINLYKNKDSKIVNEAINTIISFYSDKDYSSKKLFCDLIMFEDAILFRELNKDGYNRYCLKSFEKLNDNKIEININNIDVLLSSNDNYNFYSNYFDNTLLSKINSVNLNTKKEIIHTREIGMDLKEREMFNKYVDFISSDHGNVSNNDNIAKEQLKSVLKETYNIDVLDIKEITGGSTNCYCVLTNEKKYFLKEFEKNKNIKSLILEYKMLNSLKNNKMPVSNFILTTNNKIAIFYKERLLIVQNFIEGKTFHKSVLPKDTLLESSLLLGKMHRVLYDEFSHDYLTDFWNNLDIEKEKKEIVFLLKLLEKIKDDGNYISLKKSLDYKMKMLLEIEKYPKTFDNLTFCMTHGDYSKRQLVCNDNKISAIVDFSSSDVLPVGLEIMRSYFLSTESCKNNFDFNFDLFVEYVIEYLKNFNLKEEDLVKMPYVFLYHLTTSKYGYMEYVLNDSNKQDIFNFVMWKDNISMFLEKNAHTISEKVKRNINL